MTHSPEFLTWRGIKSRCKNPKTPAYAYYGGRGITVCDRWDASFEAFYEDMGPRPPGATIDRIDNSKGYEPGNCRWADLATQAINRTDNVVIEFGGEKKCLAEWERSRGFRQSTLAQRLRKGWTVERAITTPVRPMKKKEAK